MLARTRNHNAGYKEGLVSETLDALRRLGSAEEILAYFRIPFDERVLDVYRMRILKEANGFLNRLGPNGFDEDELYARFRAFLHGVYPFC